MKRWPLISAVVMLASAWGLMQSLSHGEPVLAKKPFAQFPLSVAGRWEGKELGMDQKILDVLRVSDYMMRVYATMEAARGTGQEENNRAGPPAPIYLYVGYYQSQRAGVTYHSPKNCLPGAGWQFIESETVAVRLNGKGAITINRAIIQKGLEKEVILYWYHDRGRVVASEYWAKGYMVWDAMTKNRTDGALVRISLPVRTTTDSAYRHALGFLQDVWPLLQDYMPSGVTES